MSPIFTEVMNSPETIGQGVGFDDLTPMHGEWIREIAFGTGDYTLQAHRGSYKSSCLAVAIAIIMILYPHRNIIFLRKTDDDVAEMMRMVGKILKSPEFRGLVKQCYRQELVLTMETTEQISTNLWKSPMGAPQLLGMGIRGSITGKHAYYVITDDICNRDDRASRAERERTKAQYDELQNIRNRGGRIINLGTPWHKDDVFTKMPNIHRYDCYTTGLISKEKLQEIRESKAERERTKTQYDELQNIRNKGGRIINLGTPWHKEDVFTKMPNIHRYDCYETGLISKAQLEQLRMSMAPSLFAANYELKHIASTEVIFSTPPRFTENRKLLRDGIAHVDAAYGGSDYTAFTCGRRDWDEDVIYLYGKLWHKPVDQVMDEIVDESRRLLCEPIRCERNGDHGFLVRELIERGAYALGYDEHMNKFVKIATVLKKWWPKIIFLEGTDREYIDQILDYTENAEHDDAPDSAACVCRVLERGL
jgi:hypothetical protein